MASVKKIDRAQTIAVVNEAEAAGEAGSAVAFPTAIDPTSTTGIEILRAEYFLHTDHLTLMQNVGDGISFGLTQIQANIPDLNLTPLTIPAGTIDFKYLQLVGAVIATNALVAPLPIVTDFPEPVLCHPASLYFWVRGLDVGIMTARSMCRITYRYLTLTDKQYQDILQTIIAQNVI